MTDDPLFAFQRQGVEQLKAWNGRALLAYDPGLGKTPTSLTYLNETQSWPAVIVCPASVKWQWQREAEDWIGVKALVLEGKKAAPPTQGRPRMVIINYDILKDWLPWLLSIKPKAIVADECHALKNRTSIRSKASRKLARKCEVVVGLTGTPIMNRPAEIWNPLNLMRPDLFGSFWNYAERFCDAKMGPFGWEHKGATNLPELNKLLTNNVMIRRTMEQVLPDMPKKIRSVVPLELSKAGWKEYKTARDQHLREISAMDLDKPQNKMSALVHLGHMKRLAAKLKARPMVDWINEKLKETDEKMLVFAIHKKMIRLLERRLEAKSVVIDGSVTGKKRQAAVDRFQNDDSVRLAIGNIEAMGEGLNMTAASLVCFAELDWRAKKHLQAERRAERIGQTKRVLSSFLIAKDTIENKLAEVNQRKQLISNEAIDGGLAADNFEIFDMLLEAM